MKITDWSKYDDAPMPNIAKWDHEDCDDDGTRSCASSDGCFSYTQVKGHVGPHIARGTTRSDGALGMVFGVWGREA